MSAVDRSAGIIGTEIGPCNDTVNHDGREARWAAERLADAGLLVTDEIQAVLNVLTEIEDGEDMASWTLRLSAVTRAYVASRKVAS